jgi:multiple sugar transport system permease protein
VLLNQKLPLLRVTRTLLLLPWVLPGIVAALLWRFMYDPQLGLFNALLRSTGVLTQNVAWLGEARTAMVAVILAAVWKGFPFSMVVYLAALQGVDPDQVEAATVDGAGPWQRFRHIVIPAISPIIRLNLLLTAIFTFNYFDLIWVTTQGGPLNSTHIFPTYIFQLGFGEFQYGAAAAYGVIAALILLVLAVLYLRELRTREAI